MRHRHSGRTFGRTSSHRKAMFSNMCNSLIEHEMIKTTLPKAKELRKYIEPLVTKSKSDSVASRRYVFDRLRSKSSVGKLFTEIGPRYQERPGGYVRVLKCGFRHGDNAPMAIIEFVDRPEALEDDLDEETLKAEQEAIAKEAKKLKAAEEKAAKAEPKKAAAKKPAAKKAEPKKADAEKEDKPKASKATKEEEPKKSAE